MGKWMWLGLFLLSVVAGGYFFTSRGSDTKQTVSQEEDEKKPVDESFPALGPEEASLAPPSAPSQILTPKPPEARPPENNPPPTTAQEMVPGQENMQTYEFPQNGQNASPYPSTDGYETGQLGQGFVDPVPPDEDFLNHNAPQQDEE